MENNSSLEVQATKKFNVPVQRLYEAWISEKDLKQWWHPMGNQLMQLVNELKEGGQILYAFETAEQKPAFKISGEYKEVKEQQRLVYTWNWEVPDSAVGDSDFELTIVFSEAGNGSRLDVKQANFKTEEAIQPHKEGWEKALNDLAQHLS